MLPEVILRSLTSALTSELPPDAELMIYLKIQSPMQNVRSEYVLRYKNEYQYLQKKMVDKQE